MAILETSATCTVKVDNNQIKHTVSGVQVEQYIDDHHELKVRLKQVSKGTGGQDFDDPATYTSFLGKSISVNIKPTGGLVDQSRELEFIGVVTEVSLDHSIDGINTVLITGHSPTVTFDGAKHNAQYFDMTASDIIGSLVRKYPITVGKIESTSAQYKYDTQYRETDYDYIQRLATAHDMFAYYNGKEFRVTKANSTDVDELVWRETLGLFNMGLGTVSQEFTAKIYNYEQKKTYSQDTKSLPLSSALSGLIKVSPEASKKIYKDSGYSTSPKLVEDAQSLDKILQTDRNSSLGNMINCHGQSNVPKVAVGHCVKIKGMDKLDGLYWVKAVEHVFEESGKYHNTFKCSPLDISYPIRKPVGRKKIKTPSFSGLHVALVVDNNDPSNLARIKVKYPWADGDTKWVRLITAHAGSSRGWVSLPEIGDEVLIGYEFGNPDHPIALGALYNKDSAPPSGIGGQKNDIKIFLTRGGNQIKLDDKDGNEEISITTKNGDNQVVLSAKKPEITVTSKGDITIKGDNITIESQKDLTIKAGANLKATASADLNTEASANMKSKAGAMLNIEGTTVTVKGNPIQLN